MKKNKLLSVIGAIVMTCCLSINVFAAAGIVVCANDGHSFVNSHTNFSSAISYRDYYNVENIEGLEENQLSLVYDNSDILVVSYNGGYICQDCLENIINEYKASHSETHSTTVTYTGTGTESYTITVPATMAPGESSDVSVSGTWASNRKLTVTAPESVKLTNSIDPSDSKTLNVEFGGINKVGDNSVAVSDIKTLSVGDITDALFGTWTGTISYTVTMADK